MYTINGAIFTFFSYFMETKHFFANKKYKKEVFFMYETFVRDRITSLRLQRGISEYKMSYDLGHSRGYINNISSGKALPSMSEFFAICEYFNITPIEFFDQNLKNPRLYNQAARCLEQLNEEDLELTLTNINRLLKK